MNGQLLGSSTFKGYSLFKKSLVFKYNQHLFISFLVIFQTVNLELPLDLQTLQGSCCTYIAQAALENPQA